MFFRGKIQAVFLLSAALLFGGLNLYLTLENSEEKSAHCSEDHEGEKVDACHNALFHASSEHLPSCDHENHFGISSQQGPALFSLSAFSYSPVVGPLSNPSAFNSFGQRFICSEGTLKFFPSDIYSRPPPIG